MVHALAIDAAGAALPPARCARSADLGRTTDWLPFPVCLLVDEAVGSGGAAGTATATPAIRATETSRAVLRVGRTRNAATPARFTFPIMSSAINSPRRTRAQPNVALLVSGAKNELTIYSGTSLAADFLRLAGSVRASTAGANLAAGPTVARLNVRIDALHAAPGESVRTAAGPVVARATEIDATAVLIVAALLANIWIRSTDAV
jgi:hypothetical protein